MVSWRQGPTVAGASPSLTDPPDETIAAWLGQQREITVIARDRGGGYGEAAARALPHAVHLRRLHRHDDKRGFAAHAVEPNQPFFSETGFYSFVAVGGELGPGFQPDSLTRAVIEATIRRKLKGKLLSIEPEYRRCIQKARPDKS